jgi:acyl carrier protein
VRAAAGVRGEHVPENVEGPARVLTIRDEVHRHGEAPLDAQMSNIVERVRKIVVEHLGVDEATVTENASFMDDLGADSLGCVELLMAFEEEFGCEIPDDAAEKIVTVKDAVSFIEAHS